VTTKKSQGEGYAKQTSFSEQLFQDCSMQSK
jgi:hypothetical protein